VLVSIVVPLYNKARFLTRTCDSIAAQSFADLEVIIVDDGSTDGSRALAEAYPDPRFRVISQTNAGPGAARNRGLSEARGAFVAFLDADDEWAPEFLSVAVERLAAADPAVAGFTSAYEEWPQRRSSAAMWRKRGLIDGVMHVTAATSPQLFIAMLAFLSPCTTLVRTEVVRRFGGFYAQDRCLYGEDAFFFLKLLLNHPILVDLEPRVRIHRDASDLSTQRAGLRPVEPFLKSSAEIEAACPAALRPLLARVLAARAFKTACVLGYWGEWRRAGEIRRRFTIAEAGGLPYRFMSLFCATPLVPLVGAAWRRLRAARSG
jgi:glycosyltransferase involved in cell wall biosynthesis